MPQHYAVEMLHQVTHRYPFLWKNYAAMQEWRRRFRLKDTAVMKAAEDIEWDPDWPDWCWAPSSLEGAMLVQDSLRAGGLAKHPPDLPEGTIGALASWRPTQGIYRFDDTLFAELADTPVSGNLPAEVLKRLPAWSVFIEVPGRVVKAIGGPLHGYFAYLDYDPVTREELFTLCILTEGITTSGCQNLTISFPMNGTIDEGISRLIKEKHMQTDLDRACRKALRETCEALMSPVLYLCAEEADVPKQEARPPLVVATKKGRFITPLARRAIYYDCGTRIGAQLRKARQQRDEHAESMPTGRTVMPHIRAAHWHTFLTGPRDQVRVPKVKWLPPIAVKLEDDIPDLATVRPVNP